jgi:hypothetical protein
MPATIFSGDYVKTLKAALRLKDQATIWSGSADPTVTPTFGRQGDIYIKFGSSPAFYQKTVADGTDTNWASASGGGESSTFTPDDVANWNPDPTTLKEALDQLADRTWDQNYVVESIVLSGTDITNKYVNLAATPITASKTRLVVVGGIEQAYTTDFTVSTNQLSWSGLFLDGVLETGDKLIVTYSK